MNKEQKEPLDNPFKDLDKSLYRDAREERRSPPAVKIKKPGKTAVAPAETDDFFAGFMREHGVAPLAKSKKVARSQAVQPAPEPAPVLTPPAPVAKKEEAPLIFPAEPEPAPQAPSSKTRLAAPSRLQEGDGGAPLTLGEHNGFAALKERVKILPVQHEKPVQPRPAQKTPPSPAKRELPPAPASQAAIPAAWGETEDTDADLFASAMSGVDTLNGGGRAVPPPPPAKNAALSSGLSDPLQDFMDGKVEFSLEFTEEFLQGHVVGLDSQIINKMKAGEYSSEAHLDLHGLNALQAWEALVGFFRSAYHKGLRCVLLVPGRGLNSPGGAGILRERLQTWFTQAPFKYVILAFCTALPKHGGAGAIYVLLRKQKKTRGKIRWDILPVDPDILEG